MDITSFASKLADQGLLGVLLVFAGFAVYRLYQKIMELQEKRITEGQSCQETMRANTQAIKDLTTVLSGKHGG